MTEALIILAQFIVPLLFLGVAFFIGNFIAKRHDQPLKQRAEQVSHVYCSDLNQFASVNFQARHAMLICADVTLGIDHFRGFLGKLKNIFGGEVKSYQKTLDRARREAMMQLLEQTHAAVHNAIANLRMEFVDISGNANMAQKASMVTILAYGTAYTST